MSPLLKKSFNAAKCKTLLQLSSQKLKILRNKHTLSVKSSRANVARLLEKGQESSAKTQVDNVFREEKLVALYTLLEQFCQLVANRIDSIKSQRECPPDLKEAVVSLIYAAQGCGEIEELKKVSSYLARKYGTEFSVTAKELRQDCGVNIQVIQNLSSLPLASDVRLRLLKDISVEHKINWDYDSAVAESSKELPDVLDGPSHFVSGSQVLDASTHDKQMPASVSMHVNEVNELASRVLNNSFGSHTMSPRSCLGSPPHNMHQPAKLNTNTETKSDSPSSRAQNASGIIGAPTVDPYALAKAKGKMDYKFISDFRGGEKHAVYEHLDPTNSIRVTQYKGQVMATRSSNLPKRKQTIRDEAERCMLDLEAAAKLALASASEAAEAARAAVAMVRKESLDKNKTSRLANSRRPPSSISGLDEPSSSPIKGGLSSVGDESRFSPLQDNSSAYLDSSNNVLEDEHKHVSRSSSIPVLYESADSSPPDSSPMRDELSSSRAESRFLPTCDDSHEDLLSNNHTLEDTTEDLFQGTVFEQNSGSQLRSSDVQDSPKPESINADHEGLDSSEVPRSSSMDRFFNMGVKEQEVVGNLSHTQKQGCLLMETENQQDKTVQIISPVPQFDEYSSDEAMEEKQCIYPSDNAILKQQCESSSDEPEVVWGKNGQNKYPVPQFDDESSREASEEETPFYLKGRPAMVKEDYDDDPFARAKSRTTRHLTNDWVEDSVSLNLQGAKGDELSLHMDDDEYLLNASHNRGKRAILDRSLVHSRELTQSGCSPSQNSKSSPRSQLDYASSGLGSMIPVTESDRSGMQDNHQKMKEFPSSYDKSSLDLRGDKIPSVQSCGDEDRDDPLPGVRRSLKWCSISEDLESTSKRPTRSTLSGESSLESSKASVDLEDGDRASRPDIGLSPQGIHASSPRKYQGMSRRSIRPTRPR